MAKLSLMAPEPRPEVEYLPQHCPLRDRDVWAILTRQADGSWRVVNCLDKDDGCFTVPCAFTAPDGEWPFLLRVTHDSAQ